MRTAENTTTENKMGTMPVGRLLITMSLPMMFSMLIQALYNIVDSIFISRVSEEALTAVSLAFPLQRLMIAFSVGTSVGINSLLARRLGERNRPGAEKVAGNGIAIMFLTYILFALVGLTASRAYMEIFTPDPDLVSMGHQYLSICMILSFGHFYSILFEKLIQATGDTLSSMLVQLLGAVVNLIFDPIFIFGLLGLPAMGVRGAAAATVLGQICSMFLGVFILRRNRFITVRFRQARLDRKISLETYKVGVPSIIMQGIGTLTSSGMNKILISFSPVATTVFGAYSKLESFVFMPIFGINNGLIPIVGYNFGARRYDRIKRAAKVGIILSTCIMGTGMAVFAFFPQALLSLFAPSALMMEIGIVAFRRISACFVFAGISIMLSGVFQGVGDGSFSMMNSIARQLVVLLPSAWLFGRLWGLESVWLCFITSEVVSLSLTLVFYSIELRKFKRLERAQAPAAARPSVQA